MVNASPIRHMLNLIADQLPATPQDHTRQNKAYLLTTYIGEFSEEKVRKMDH